MPSVSEQRAVTSDQSKTYASTLGFQVGTASLALPN